MSKQTTEKNLRMMACEFDTVIMRVPKQRREFDLSQKIPSYKFNITESFFGII